MRMRGSVVLSGYHIRKLLSNGEGRISISLDLGVTRGHVMKSGGTITFPDSQELGMSALEKAERRRKPEDCFLVRDNELVHVYAFESRMIYRLYEPKMDWPPTLWINGSMMHRVSTSTPTEEARAKLDALGSAKGSVLDTCFGLGYTAMEAARRGAHVVSYELSGSVLEIARLNPWSANAFSNDSIDVRNSDIASEIDGLEEGSFDSVLHDPPNVQMSGELYSLSFYQQLHRVLKRGGRLYHYIGSGRVPIEHKRNYVGGVMKRLADSGFTDIRRSLQGVTATRE